MQGDGAPPVQVDLAPAQVASPSPSSLSSLSSSYDDGPGRVHVKPEGERVEAALDRHLWKEKKVFLGSAGSAES